ncbi:Tetratricopeptide repeat-like superfamily protein [Prunus dulcis]|uniref:Tetratricopeptide repeat-like superfamily protein n=1 Tax=Prunus dulcis TaxID=3755 RepID=A0A4Y1REF3_PRUDU|nr:Tetratricopeptide repeat-like superfamily protein [Prunus dulcis]
MTRVIMLHATLIRCFHGVSDAQKGSSDEFFKECIMRLSWALVHSRQPEDVQRGIAMLEASVAEANANASPLQLREKLYLLAVGITELVTILGVGNLWNSIAPDWRQALTLKKMNEDKIKRDGAIGIGIAATAVGLIAGGIAAAVARKK